MNSPNKIAQMYLAGLKLPSEEEALSIVKSVGINPDSPNIKGIFKLIRTLSRQREASIGNVLEKLQNTLKYDTRVLLALITLALPAMAEETISEPMPSRIVPFAPLPNEGGTPDLYKAIMKKGPEEHIPRLNVSIEELPKARAKLVKDFELSKDFVKKIKKLRQTIDPDVWGHAQGPRFLGTISKALEEDFRSCLTKETLKILYQIPKEEVYDQASVEGMIKKIVADSMDQIDKDVALALGKTAGYIT
jgi:hypothetical protein